ncbi:MAG: GNAT family N-acetyltransferase [Bdellovibrionota bacterium]
MLNAKNWIDQVFGQTRGRDDGASFIRSLGILKEARITTARLTLRALDPKDLSLLEKILNENRESFFLIPPNYHDEGEAYLKRVLLAKGKSEEVSDISTYFALYDSDRKVFLGFASLDYNAESNVYSMPYMIAKEEQNKGYGTEALAALVDVYRKLSSNQIPIQVRVQSTNTASRRVFEKLGFQYQSEVPSRLDEGYQVPPLSVYELRE